MSSDQSNISTNVALEPIEDSDWPTGIKDMLTGFAGGLNVYRIMAHHPALLRAWASLRDHIVNHSALRPEDLEVVILRTGHRLGSSYEWQQHIERARAKGLSDQRIAAIRGPLADMSRGDAVLCKAVDELFDTSTMQTETVEQLFRTIGKPATFDLMATVGFYSTLGYILNSFDTPLDADIAERLAANPLQS